MFGMNIGKLGCLRKAASVFSPAKLFSSGEQGIWLDCSDLSTMFQDAAGTTPVTADGQPVGLILDKSKGLVLGPELVTNGDFNSATGWTLVGASISGGNLTFSSSAINDYAANSGGISAANVLFEITFTITSIASGSVRPQAGGKVGTARTSAGTYSERLVSISGGTFALVATSANTTAVVSDISLKVVTGNHASQATAAARPLYKTDGTYHWLQFDGIDDGLSTGNIDFSATALMSVFGGVAHPNSAVGTLVQLSASDVTPGMLFVRAPGHIADTYGLAVGGSTAQLSTATPATFPPPQKAVLAVGFDISVPEATITLQVDAVNVVISSSILTGAGTFANAPLYIGWRGGGGVGLTGDAYSLIVRGSASSPAEVADTEAWVNGKTGAY